jgi:hypothetical protein
MSEEHVCQGCWDFDPRARHKQVKAILGQVAPGIGFSPEGVTMALQINIELDKAQRRLA